MKYMGSKNRIAKYIVPILENSFIENECIDLIDACTGGANLIDKVRFTQNLFAYDVNEYIISMWQELQRGWIPDFVSRELYKKIMNDKEKYPKHLVGWVGVACSYSGKWFGGYAGETITKQGVRNYQTEALSNLKKQINCLGKVKFNCVSLFELNPINKSLIYCDIPYRDTTGYKDNFNHDAFYKWCFKMKELGHIIFISEYNMPKEFTEVWSIEVKSSFSANGNIGGSIKSLEKLFRP